MPIDLTHLAAAASASWMAESRRLGLALGLLGPQLAARLERITALETRTRAFPVFAFEGLALDVRIHPQQHGTVRPYRRWWNALGAPFAAFGRGFTRIGQAVEDEMVLPGVIAAVNDILSFILGSVDRLIAPRAASFDPRNARGSDIFGLMAMAWRGLTTSTGQLRLLAGDLTRAAAVFRTPAGPGVAAAAPGAPAAPAMATPANDALEAAGHWITGAILVIPALPGWLGVLAEAAWLRGRVWLLDTFQAIEARVFELRTQVLRIFFVTIPALLREVPALVVVIGSMLQWNIQYFAFFANLYFDEMLFSIRSFFDDLHDYINGFITLVNTVLHFIDRVMDFDLLSLVTPFMGPAGAAVSAFGIRFTINDLLDATGAALNWAMYHALKGAILAAKAAAIALDAAGSPVLGTVLTRPPSSAIVDKLDLLERIVDALFRDTGGPLAETAAPTLTPMPNFYDLLFGAPPAVLAHSLRSFGERLAGDVRGLFDSLSGSLGGFGAVFSRSAADVARTGPAARMPGFGREAAGLANALYEDQVRELGARLRDTPSRSFEQWLVKGGFHVIGAVIPLYVAEMRRYWHEQADAGNEPYVEITPTSPHILARRARLGRVRVPRMTLRTGGQPLAEGLVRELARRFQGAVQEAFATGQARMQQYAAAAT